MAERQSYNTKTRTEILEFLEGRREETVSVSDIVLALNASGKTISEATVYRYLGKLEKSGMIIKYVAKKGESAVYQYTGSKNECSEHLHLKCTACGRLMHLDCDFMDELKRHLYEEHRFNLTCGGNILYGLCGECSTKEN